MIEHEVLLRRCLETVGLPEDLVQLGMEIYWKLLTEMRLGGDPCRCIACLYSRLDKNQREGFILGLIAALASMGFHQSV
jgi:hypothetical protein